MANIKQRSLKPATTIPEAAGILAYNGSGVDIPANALVIIAAGLQGSALKIQLSSATLDERGGKVPVFVAKHAIPQNERGVILPWVILTGVDTSGVTAAGDAVYLADALGEWVPTKTGTVDRMVGVALTDLAAPDGVVWLSPGNFSYGTD
jgi:hypothetical protein